MPHSFRLLRHPFACPSLACPLPSASLRPSPDSLRPRMIGGACGSTLDAAAAPMAHHGSRVEAASGIVQRSRSAIRSSAAAAASVEHPRRRPPQRPVKPLLLPARRAPALARHPRHVTRPRSLISASTFPSQLAAPRPTNLRPSLLLSSWLRVLQRAPCADGRNCARSSSRSRQGGR